MVAQGAGQRENSPAYRNMRKHAVHQVRRGIGHFLIAAPYRACVRSRSRGVRSRTDKRICLCKRAAGADPCRTIRTGDAKTHRPRLRKTSTPASRVQQTAGPRGRVLPGERENFPDVPRSSDTAGSPLDSVADTHCCHSIRIEHTNDPQPTWPARSKPHTARPVPRID